MSRNDALIRTRALRYGSPAGGAVVRRAEPFSTRGRHDGRSGGVCGAGRWAPCGCVRRRGRASPEVRHRWVSSRGSVRSGMGGLPLYSPICAQTVTLRVICDAPALRQRNRSRLWKLNVLHHQKAPTSLRRVRTLPYVGFRRAPRVSCSINALAIPEGRFVHPRQRDRG
jgi:hypothetical protein